MDKQSQNMATPEEFILMKTLPDKMILVEGGTFEMGSNEPDAIY